ncbi:MAG TPA: glycosyl hydrolase [Verrucomicrobiae bacterium]|jgi:hypothetical protein|nr:glycosyl hydrolase [Verrucomicrobiae bacterium]
MIKLQRLHPGIAALFLVLTAAAGPTDPLESGFLNPPNTAKPQTWWQWMNGNVTKTGITADLEAMKQIGLGGATVVNLDCDIPRGNVSFMSPEWREDFKFAVEEADRLGLKLGVENCAGWSSSGGPWNTATNAMQRLTSSETNVEGPVAFNAQLPQPPITLGFYRDIAVLAFKVPSAEEVPASARKKLEITRAVYGVTGAGTADVTARLAAFIKSGKKSMKVSNDAMGGDPIFGQVKQLRIEFTADGKPDAITVGENDTLTYSPAASQPFAVTPGSGTFVQPPSVAGDAIGPIPHDGVLNLTSMLAADGRLKWSVPAGRWTILRLGYTPIGVENHPAPREGTGLECDKLSKSALDEHWAGFMQKILDDVGPFAGKTLQSSFIDSYEVGNQDWTENFRQEFEKRRGYDPLKFLPAFTGRLVDSPQITERFLWDMRRTVADLFAENYFGHFTELCRQHGLASQIEPYTGPFESLQCGAPEDIVMGEFWTGSQGDASVKLAASVAHIYGKSVVGAESFTAGRENAGWQNDPYALKALGDLMFSRGINRYYFHRYAMQPWTNRWPGMTMGEFGLNFERTLTWWDQGKAWIDYISRCEFLLQQGRAAADAAYFDGQSAPVEMPADNPPLPAGYDYDGVNADVLLHGATVKNGRLTLRSGASYAVLILPPDDINMTPPMLKGLSKLVREGATVIGPRPQHSPSLNGFPECDRQVKDLAAELWGDCDGVHVRENNYGQGHVIWGKSPAEVLAAQNLKPDFEFQGATCATRLVFIHRIAGAADIYFVSNQRRQFDSTECTFRVAGKIPELWHPDTGMMETAPIWRTEDGRTKVRLDLDPAGSVFVIFRHAADHTDHVVAADGALNPNSTGAPAWETTLAPNGSPEIRAWSNAGQAELRTANGKVLRAAAENLPAPQEIAGPWNLSFPPNWGAPPSVTLEKLISWTDHPNQGVRYFSGTATYETEIEISPERLAAGREVWLDLGAVKNFAEVSLNGHDFAVLWKPPFRLNVTAAAKAGANKLLVKVTNLWPNRLIGDEQLPPDCEWGGNEELKAWPQWLLEGKPSPTGRLTFTTWHHIHKDSPLLESGLLGPVTLRTAELIPAK